MLGVFTTKIKDEEQVNKNSVHFVHIPEEIKEKKEDIEMSMAKTARDFANATKSSRVYLLYGKEIITYDY